MKTILAYILISLKEKNAEDVVDEIQQFKGVEEVKIIFGEWDILVKVKTETPEELSTFMLDKIRPMDTIKLTSTLIVAK